MAALVQYELQTTLGDAAAADFAVQAWRQPCERSAFIFENAENLVHIDGGVALLSPLLLWLPFDFNPLHLQDPKAEPVATFLELRADPQTGANAIEIIKPDLTAANTTATRLGALPEVARTATLGSLVPADQDAKLALIRQLAAKIGPSLHPTQTQPPPSDQQNIEALRSTGSCGSMCSRPQAKGGSADSRWSPARP